MTNPNVILESSKTFLPGETVYLKSRYGLSPITPKYFEILNKLPNSEGRSQYRIVNKRVGHERVELGSNLLRATE